MSLQGVNTVQLQGTRLIASADTGDYENDIATKRYVDWWHYPFNSYRHYIGFIKSRQYTLVPLTGLMKISTDLTISHGNIVTVLESAVYPGTFYFSNQNVEGKYIQISYMFDVWVEAWNFYTHICTDITVVFKWQASTNGKSWIDIGNAKFECPPAPTNPTSSSLYINKGQWKFSNPTRKGNKGYRHWRLKGVSGEIKSACFVNILLMRIV